MRRKLEKIVYLIGPNIAHAWNPYMTYLPQDLVSNMELKLPR